MPGSTALLSPMMWSEVFARCDHPSSIVRWSEMSAVDGRGRVVRPTAMSVNYQAASQGGCSNTNSWVDGDGFVQATNTERTTPQGAVLEVES